MYFHATLSARPALSLSLCALSVLCLCLHCCSASRFHMCVCVNIRYLFFSFWFTLFSIIGFRFIHFIRTDSNVFLLWLSNIPLMMTIFSCPLAIYMSSLGKYLFKSSTHFLISFFIFFIWVVWAMYSFYINSLSVISFENIFSRPVGCLFIL